MEGDVGDSTSYSQVAPTQAQIAADNPAFVLVSGDLTYGNSHGQAAVDQHFNDTMAWAQTAAYMPAWGNHDWDEPTTDDLRNYKGRFAIPNPQTSPGAPAPGCCGEDWGWFDAGGVRFISYPEPWTGAWSDWQTKADLIMAAAQADPNINFIVTFGHRPAYSTGHHPGSAELASILNALGDKYSKYVLNFNAHSHDYERFVPIHGVTHITAAGGGASLETSGLTTDPRSAFRAFHLEHVRVDVTSTSMHVEAVCGPPSSKDLMSCTQGSVIDSVTIGTPVDAAPTASLTLPSSALVGQSVTADASGSTDQDATGIGSYTFNFGDGSPTVTTLAPTASTTHTYTAAGTYTVQVRVTDTAGNSSIATMSISVGSSATNLVGNSGFEADTSGWRPLGSGVTLTRSSGGHSGAWSAKLTNTGTSLVTCRLDDSPNWVSSTSSGTYAATIWVRADQAGAKLTEQIREYKSGIRVGSKSASVVLSSSWQPVSMTYAPASAGSTLDFNVYVDSAPPGTCFYGDDAVITRAP